MYKRNRAPRISLGSLLVTFLLGVVIGGAAVYGIVGGDAPVETEPPVERAPLETAEPAPDIIEAPEPIADPRVEPEPEREPVEAEAPAGPIRGARFLFVSTRGTALSDESRAFLADFQPGGVILLGHNIENRNQTIAYVDAIKQAAGMGTDLADLPLIAVDQEGGPVNRLRLREAPSAAELGAQGDIARVAAVAANYARACQTRGIALALAPVFDIRDEAGPAGFERRTFGEDRMLVAELGLVFARALMDGGVLPVAKHYPGHGSATADTHDGPALLEHSFEELAHIMYPFAEAAARGMPGIMAGHITVTQMDPDAPATMSGRLLRQVLRERWGYEGVIIADDLAMRAITDEYSLEEAAVRALQAGCDALIITEPDFDTLRRVALAIERAVEQGILDEANLRRSEQRLEGWQAWLRAPETTLIDIPMPSQEETDAEQILEDLEETEAETETEIESEPMETEAEEAVPVEESAEETPEPAEDDAEAEGDALEEGMDEAEESEPEVTEAAASTEGLVAVRHQVQQGEWLSRIAVQYGVSTRDLVEWNNLPSDNVRYGTRLTIYLPPERAAAFTGGGENGSAAEAEPDDEAAAEEESESAGVPSGTRAIIHDVLPGETLTQLGRRYRVGTSDIVEWNDLTNTHIRVGQQLTIHVPENAEFGE